MTPEMDWSQERMHVTHWQDAGGDHIMVLTTRRGKTLGRLRQLALIATPPVRRVNGLGWSYTESARQVADRLFGDKLRELVFRLYPEQVPPLLPAPAPAQRRCGTRLARHHTHRRR